jgi:hypothetical protein
MRSYLPVSTRMGATPHRQFENVTLYVRGIIALHYNSVSNSPFNQFVIHLRMYAYVAFVTIEALTI